MKFMVLIRDDWSKGTAEETLAAQAPVAAQHGQFAGGLVQSGRWIDGARLRPPSEAVRVTRKAGRNVLVDGPFAEAKEVLGGFYLFEAASREEAIETAKKVPTLEHDVLELREVMSVADPKTGLTGGGTKFMATVASDDGSVAAWDETMEKVDAGDAESAKVFTSGAFLGGARLQNVQKAVRITKSGGKQVVNDGPFAEAKEIVGGYVMLQCATRDEAVALAGQWAGAAHGVVDVFPVWPMG